MLLYPILGSLLYKILFIYGKFVWDYTINTGIQGNTALNAIQNQKLWH